eukprot:2308980-Rhodomonas_salina.2
MFRLKPRRNAAPPVQYDSTLGQQKQSRAPTRDSSPSQWSRNSFSRARTGVSTSFNEHLAEPLL